MRRRWAVFITIPIMAVDDYLDDYHVDFVMLAG